MIIPATGDIEKRITILIYDPYWLILFCAQSDGTGEAKILGGSSELDSDNKFALMPDYGGLRPQPKRNDCWNSRLLAEMQRSYG
jgi:hypothetical protein